MSAVKLPQRRRLGVYLTAGGLWLSGGVWLLGHYFLIKQGEYGPTISPVETTSLKVHGAFAMLGLWVFGLLWGVHILRAWPTHKARWSGGLLVGLFGLLIVSGYLLYYAGGDALRAAVSLTHWIIGLAALPFFLWHRFAKKTKPRHAHPHGHPNRTRKPRAPRKTAPPEAVH